MFLISENSLKFANFFAEVTNSRSMVIVLTLDSPITQVTNTTNIVVAYELYEIWARLPGELSGTSQLKCFHE